MEKRCQEDRELEQVERDLSKLLEKDGGGMLTQRDKDTFIRLEGKRNTLLLEKEETWRLKGRATWLECGDENTKFCHAYARGRKATNTIWSLLDEHGDTHTTFDGMDRNGVDHFKKLFEGPAHASIIEVIIIAQLFPRFVEEEDNKTLMKEVS